MGLSSASEICVCVTWGDRKFEKEREEPRDGGVVRERVEREKEILPPFDNVVPTNF